VQEINNPTLKLQTLISNFAIAIKWTQNLISLINDLDYAFQQILDTTIEIKTWKPPPPPEIIFYKQNNNFNIPKTKNGVPPSLKELHTNSINLDNQTAAKVNEAT
jgi:hypothetical protein